MDESLGETMSLEEKQLTQALLDLQRMSDITDSFRAAKSVIDTVKAGRAEIERLEAHKIQLEQNILRLDVQMGQKQGQFGVIAADVEQAKAKAEVEKAAMHKQSMVLSDEITAKEKRIAGLDAEYAERNNGKQSELVKLQANIDNLKAARDKLLKQFAA
jgi:hypothetical protein